MSGNEPNTGRDSVRATLIDVLADMLDSALRWEAERPDEAGTATGLTEQPSGLNCLKANQPADLESELHEPH